MPAKANGSNWKTISLTPLTGLLDVRSRPAEVPTGGFRFKQSFAVTPEAKLCRRAGFSKAFSDVTPYVNQDLHSQGKDRSPITMLFESTSSTDQRSLFAGTQTDLYTLDETTGIWTNIYTVGGAAGHRFHAAELKDYVLFTNGVDVVLSYALGDPSAQIITDIQNVSAKVIIQYQGFIILMNINDGVQRSTRIKWCDLNLPLSWQVGAPNSVAGVQDLPFGDDILAAAPILGGVNIYTRRGIWRMQVTDPTSTDTFSFTQIYSEPKNQTGCLVYPNTLVSTGTEHFYASREGWYRYSPYEPQPVRDDWLHRATGVIFTKADTRFDGADCDAPVSEYTPTTRELWISWPSTGNANNDLTLVAQIEQKTADIVDTGFITFVNYRRTPIDPQCNESQDFLGVSSLDWTIKDIGVGFFREIAVLSQSLSTDLPLNGQQYVKMGYNSILRGLIPLGLYDREKIVRTILLDHDTSDQDVPCIIKLRVGNSAHLVDANDTDVTCAPLWRFIGNRPLACPDKKTIPQMQAANLRPTQGTDWRLYAVGTFLYWEMTITNADGTPAIGGDSCWQRIDFDGLAKPKP